MLSAHINLIPAVTCKYAPVKVSVVAPLGRPTLIGPEAFDAKNRTFIMAYNCYCSGHTKYLRRRIKGHNEWERWNKNV